MNTWFEIARAAASVAQDPKRLISFAAERVESAEHVEPRAVLPWAFAGALSIPIALLVGVPTAGIGLGLIVGALIATTLAWHTHRQARKQARDIARVIADVHADADQRVALVTRQYEWAVNDIANLRDALRRAQAARPTGDAWADRLRRQARRVERRAEVAMVGRIRHDGQLATVRLEPRDGSPEMVRVVDESGAVVAISARSLEPDDRTTPAFLLRVREETASVLADPDARGFRVEALIDEHWCRVDLRETVMLARIAARPAGPVTDKRGRVYGVAS